MNSSYRSRMGLWNKIYEREHSRKMYADPATAKVAGGFLNHEEIQTIEDWGCGYGGFKNYIGKNQKYIGIDGSKSQYPAKIADLELYTSDVDAIHMRGVIEHNNEWAKILENSTKSFKKRMVLTLFTPFQSTTKIIDTLPNFCDTGVDMIDIAFSRQDIIIRFGKITFFSIENIKTKTKYNVEHMFFLEK